MGSVIMHFFVNDLSLHGQYHDIPSFKASLCEIMKIKMVLSHYGYALHIHRNFYATTVGRTIKIKDAITTLSMDQQRALMSWLTTSGPFWTDNKRYSGTDIFDDRKRNVSGSAIAEIAYCCIYLDEKASSVSFSPSEWERNPILVTFEEENICVDNFWTSAEIDNYASSSLPAITSWNILEDNSKKCFQRLNFLDDAFSYLCSEPFSLHVSKEIFNLLHILNILKGCFDSEGNRTPEWDEKYRTYFKGKTPRFSDSSTTEKNNFRSQLTFRNPETKERSLFCPWHGKIHSPQIRIHFTFPITAEDSLFIAYIGPKITKK